MRGIVQYEVYVLEHGNWALHARYAGAQRTEALSDATETESLTGKATKVVRDTYYPESNQNEEITTYLSPRARALRAVSLRSRKARDPRPPVRKGLARKVLVRTAMVHASPARQRRTVPVNATIRAAVAIALSLFAASAATALVSWPVTHIPAFANSPEVPTAVLTLTYGVVFLLMLPRMFRARLRIHRILAEMWDAKPRTAPTPSRRVAVRPQARRERERDNRIVPERPAPVPEPPTLAEPPAAEAAPASPAPGAKPAAPTPPPPAAPTTAKPVPIPVAPAKPEPMTLERIIVMRFAVDVIVPALLRSSPDDPVTRRGIALILAGVVAGIAETSGVSQLGRMALLSDGLKHAGGTPGAIEAFVNDYTGHVSAPSAQPLIEAGTAAVKSYLEGGQNIARDLQAALAQWRVPSFAHSSQLRPASYLLSELRSDAATSPFAAVHDAIVRAVAQEAGGSEVLHQDRAVFVHFADGAAAEPAGRKIAERLAAIGALPATMVVLTNVDAATPALELLEQVLPLLNDLPLGQMAVNPETAAKQPEVPELLVEMDPQPAFAEI